MREAEKKKHRFAFFGMKLGEPCPRCLRIITDEVLEQKAAHYKARMPHQQPGAHGQIDLELAKQMRDEGCTFKEIGEEFGVTPSAVAVAFKKWFGVTKRRPRGL